MKYFLFSIPLLLVAVSVVKLPPFVAIAQTEK
jgi:hypothetical protein